MLTKPRGRVLLAIFAAAIVSQIGCIHSTNPLVAPEKAETDKSLYGAWRGILPNIGGPEPTEDSFYYIGRAGKGYPEGMMRLVLVTADRKSGPAALECFFFEARIGGVRYLNFASLPDGSRPAEEWKPEGAKLYMIARCTVQEDVLTLEFVNKQALKDAVDAKKLQGTRDADGYVDHLTSSTDELAKFFATPDAKALFSERPDMQLKLKRVK